MAGKLVLPLVSAQAWNNNLHNVFRHTGVAHTDDIASREQGLAGHT